MLSFLFSKKYNDLDLRGSFNAGYQLGKQDGIKLGMSLQFDNTNELTEKQHQEVIEFLVSRELELCYDPMRGGFRVRKRKYNLPN